VLRIDAAAPKDKILAEFGFQAPGIHAAGADLDGIQDVHAHRDQVRNVLGTIAAGVIPDFGLRVFLDGINHSLLARSTTWR